MALPEALLAQIEAFVATPSASQGGYAPVGPTDIEQLSTILHGLLEVKYETDPDGDLPVTFELLDRTRFGGSYYAPIRHLRGEDEHDIRALSNRLRSAISNLATAQREVDMAHRAMEWGLVERTENGLTVSSGKTTYGPLLKATDHTALKTAITTTMESFFQDHPVSGSDDYDARLSWASLAEKALQAATGATVKVRCLTTRSTGDRVVDVELLSLRRRGQEYGPSVRLTPPAAAAA